MITMSLTRYFVCDEGHESAWTPSWSGSAGKLGTALKQFASGPVPGLPDIGTNWREMTEEEAKDYLARVAEDRLADNGEDE